MPTIPSQQNSNGPLLQSYFLTGRLTAIVQIYPCNDEEEDLDDVEDDADDLDADDLDEADDCEEERDESDCADEDADADDADCADDDADCDDDDDDADDDDLEDWLLLLRIPMSPSQQNSNGPSLHSYSLTGTPTAIRAPPLASSQETSPRHMRHSKRSFQCLNPRQDADRGQRIQRGHNRWVNAGS